MLCVQEGQRVSRSLAHPLSSGMGLVDIDSLLVQHGVGGSSRCDEAVTLLERGKGGKKEKEYLGHDSVMRDVDHLVGKELASF